MNNFIKVLKRTFMENVVLIVIIIAFFVYLLVTGDADTKRILVFLTLFPVWLGFTYGFLSALFDWQRLKVLRKQILACLSVGLFISIVLFYFGWREELYVYVAGGSVVGAAMFIVEKVFSIGRR